MYPLFLVTLLSVCCLQSLLAKQPVTPTRGAAVSHLTFLHMQNFEQGGETCFSSLSRFDFCFQDSQGRTSSGSPRPAGRAGPTTVSGGSPMASVKKPDPNIKGNNSGGLIKMVQSFSLGCFYATNFILGFIL